MINLNFWIDLDPILPINYLRAILLNGELRFVTAANPIQKNSIPTEADLLPPKLTSVEIIMITRLAFFICAALMFSTSTTQAQLINFLPSAFNAQTGDGPINATIDISSSFNRANGSVTLSVANGFVNPQSGGFNWTVSETESTTFTVNSIFDFQAVVSHGPNLGSGDFSTGSAPRDGVIAAPGESFTLDPATLDSDYVGGQAGNSFFVDYVGPDTGAVASNSTAFRFVSDQPVSEVTVFSTNTVELANNFSFLLQDVTAVPEPSALALLALTSGLFLTRRRQR